MVTLLKRYANRRLYDTRLSRYITLEDMAHRIRKGEDFQVQDAQTDEDLTRKVLMQVIVLESLDIAELLPIEFLTMLIRVRERGVQELFVRYLRVTMESFSLASRQLEDNVRLVQQQMSVTAQLMRHILPFASATNPSGTRAPEPAGAGRTSGEAVSADAATDPDDDAAELTSISPADDSIPVQEETLFSRRSSRSVRGRSSRRRR